MNGTASRIRPSAQPMVLPDQTCPVRLVCGCEGMFLPAASHGGGVHPFVSVRIVGACTGGHPEQVAPGVIVRVPVGDSPPFRLLPDPVLPDRCGGGPAHGTPSNERTEA